MFGLGTKTHMPDGKGGTFVVTKAQQKSTKQAIPFVVKKQTRGAKIAEALWG